jgi:hypothetical protein
MNDTHPVFGERSETEFPVQLPYLVDQNVLLVRQDLNGQEIRKVPAHNLAA